MSPTLPVRLLSIAIATAIPLCLAGCGEQSERERGAPPEQAGPPAPISGLYEVQGFTVNAGSGDNKRRISGTVVISEQGSQYTATFSLKTSAPGLGGDHMIDVIGKGEGSIEGRTLTGTASTQLVTSVVPGVDPGFAFVPRQTSTRIVNTSVASIAHDGAVKIEIESEGAPGENYVPTRTILRGMRVAAAGIGGPKD